MTARTYALIFFLWAILTVITPSLVFLSENSKLGFADSTGEKSAEIKTRKMMGHEEKNSIRTLIALVKMHSLASGTVAGAAPASAPAPAMRASIGPSRKRAEQHDYNSKREVMYREILAQMLFDV